MNIVMLPVEAVSLGHRQRSVDPSVDKHIEDLAKDIDQNGLIHSIAIDKNNNLVSGWCRIHAIQKLNKSYKYASSDIAAGFVPCIVVHQDSERELFRIELMENLRRKNLSPIDEAKAVAKLHRFFIEETGPLWTKGDTGKELDSLRGVEKASESTAKEVSDALLLEGFDKDTDVIKAKTRGEAVKIVRKKLEQQLMNALGDLKPSSNQDFKIYNGSCIDMDKWTAFEEGTFNGVVVDPPYGIGADTFGEQTNVLGHEYLDKEEDSLRLAESIFNNTYRLCKDTAHLYLFCDIRLFTHLYGIAHSSGWKPYATPLIWHKEGLGHAPQPGYFSRRYECILFAQKGNRKLSKSRSDVFSYPSVKDKIHAAQKPVELIRELLSLSFFPGELILDPCCGSGTIFRAAKALSMKVVGIELNETNFNICKKVISEL